MHRTGQPDVPFRLNVVMVVTPETTAAMIAAGFTPDGAPGAWTRSDYGDSGCDRIAQPGMLLTRCYRTAQLCACDHHTDQKAPSCNVAGCTCVEFKLHPLSTECPDCLTREQLRPFQPEGARRENLVLSAVITHWPGEPNEVVDDLVEGVRVSGTFPPLPDLTFTS